MGGASRPRDFHPQTGYHGWHIFGSIDRPRSCPPMVWFFEREAERLQYEIRREEMGEGFELVISASADEKTVEKVTSPSELIERSQNVWNFLLNGGWRPIA
jgi:hypothetical protein